jgi:hypothetical protein
MSSTNRGVVYMRLQGRSAGNRFPEVGRPARAHRQGGTMNRSSPLDEILHPFSFCASSTHWSSTRETASGCSTVVICPASSIGTRWACGKACCIRSCRSSELHVSWRPQTNSVGQVSAENTGRIPAHQQRMQLRSEAVERAHCWPMDRIPSRRAVSRRAMRRVRSSSPAAPGTRGSVPVFSSAMGFDA